MSAPFPKIWSLGKRHPQRFIEAHCVLETPT
jgi:hypothetical protein